MLYVVYAIEISSGLPFEQLCNCEEVAQRVVESLGDKYKDICVEPRYSSLDEMYADL